MSLRFGGRCSSGRWVVAVAALVACASCATEVVIGYAPLNAHGSVDAGEDAALPLPDVTWLSGGHPGNDVSMYLELGDWRGRPLAFAHLFPDRASWDGLIAPGWPVDMFEPFEGFLILSVPPYPEALGTNLDCAMGAYDDEWARLGTFLIERGRADTILRLGWGPNDLEHEWHVASNADGTANQTDLQNWLDCFRNVVMAVRSTDPEIRIDWTFNAIGSPRIATFDPYVTYPGDEYVDYVGLEVFDMYPAIRSDEAWQAQCNSPTGLCTLFEFARAHSKPVGIAEWAVVACDRDGQATANVGGDNPFFVAKVFETFAANADTLAYEAYFEDGTGEVCSNLDEGGDNPSTTAKYKELFGGR